ncbi:hypothetical protein F8388_012525 [Cannabis sativa]|uniref:Homeobox domain-containing protein n=1 Tax=Cannabis sativa TaxID=3483 RepID=A0A7J6H0S2_CANSA|nr:hypothetical protein F8388_012525 [Cannabis sativa]
MENESSKEEMVTGSNGLFVKVMTDEQMELLRRQISVYATICEKLAEMHKAISTHHDFSGMKLGAFHCDPLMAYAGHKITSRQRWSPTPLQLQILERIFDEGNGTPTKQKIKEITSELTQHGQISETNESSFQRKQSVSAPPNNMEPEAETETEFVKDNTKPEDNEFYDNSVPMDSTTNDVYFPSPEELISWSTNGGVLELQPFPSWGGGFNVDDL